MSLLAAEAGFTLYSRFAGPVGITATVALPAFLPEAAAERSATLEPVPADQLPLQVLAESAIPEHVAAIFLAKPASVSAQRTLGANTSMASEATIATLRLPEPRQAVNEASALPTVPMTSPALVTAANGFANAEPEGSSPESVTDASSEVAGTPMDSTPGQAFSIDNRARQPLLPGRIGPVAPNPSIGDPVLALDDASASPMMIAANSPPRQPSPEVSAASSVMTLDIALTASLNLGSAIEGAAIARLDNGLAAPYIKPAVLFALGSIPNRFDFERRKDAFLKTTLPLIESVNRHNLALRNQILALGPAALDRAKHDKSVTAMLEPILIEFEMSEPNIDELLLRVDMVPPSLALAQAAVESGWGSSNMARNGNALFGQMMFDVVHNQAGQAFVRSTVRGFSEAGQSVSAYMHNLNTHPAYGAFRRARARLRETGLPPDGAALSAYLVRYSERGKDYIQSVQDIMRWNNLENFDRATPLTSDETLKAFE